MKWYSAIAAFVFVLALGRPLAAQSGELNDSTEYAMITGMWVNNHHGPFEAIVVWRGPRGWRQPGGAAKERADSVFRFENLRAREAGRSFFGMGMAYGILDRHAAAVTVEGQRFSLDRTDSALVIMVPRTPPSGDVHFPSPQLLRNVLAQVPAIGVFLR